MYHRRIVDECQMLHIHAKVRPVRCENVLRTLRELQRVKHLFCGIRARTEHVGILFLQNVGIRMTGGRRDIRDAVEHLLEQIEQLRHLRTAAGNVFLHLFDERFDPGGHRHVHGRSVGILADNAEAIVYPAPFYLHAVLIHDRPHIAGIIHGSQIAEFVQ